MSATDARGCLGCTVRGAVVELPFDETALSARRARSSGARCSRTSLGLVLAFVLANLLVPHAGTTGDRVSSGLEYLAFLLAIPWLGPPAPTRGPLRPRRGAHRPLDRRRHRRRLPQRHDRRLDLRALRRRYGSRRSPVLARLGVFWLLAVAPDPDAARGRARALPAPARLHAERGHRRRGGRRPAARAASCSNHREYGINLVGFVDDRPTELDDDLAQRLPLLLGGARRACASASWSTASSA